MMSLLLHDDIMTITTTTTITHQTHIPKNYCEEFFHHQKIDWFGVELILWISFQILELLKKNIPTLKVRVHIARVMGSCFPSPLESFPFGFRVWFTFLTLPWFWPLSCHIATLVVSLKLSSNITYLHIVNSNLLDKMD